MRTKDRPKTKDELRAQFEVTLAKEWGNKFYDDFGLPGSRIGPFFGCLLCGGIEPTELAHRNYISEALGHKSDCDNAKY